MGRIFGKRSRLRTTCGSTKPCPSLRANREKDRQQRAPGTNLCLQQFLEDAQEFQWLTHQANYTNFPACLLVTCVFDTQEGQKLAETNVIHKLIQSKPLKIGVKLKAPKQQIIFDSEEACSKEDDGNWGQRLGSRELRSVARNRPN